MPTYVYRCPECRYTTEVFHRMTEKPVIRCPECQEGGVDIETGKYNPDLRGQTMVKLISSGAGVIFKGDGWTPKFH